MLCDALVLSHLNHCDVVYGPCLDSVAKRRIQVMQHCCIRLTLGIRGRRGVTRGLREIGWLNMYNRRQLHSASFFYKIIKFRVPPYLYHKLVFRRDIHNLNIRKKVLLTIPRHRKEIYKRSYSYCVASLINEHHIFNFDSSPATFKRHFRMKLLERQK